MKQTSTAHGLGSLVRVVPLQTNHDGLISSRLLDISEVVDSEQCPGGFCDPRHLVALRKPLDNTHLSSAWKRIDAADSRHEGPQFGQEEMRALQGEREKTAIGYEAWLGVVLLL